MEKKKHQETNVLFEQLMMMGLSTNWGQYERMKRKRKQQIFKCKKDNRGRGREWGTELTIESKRGKRESTKTTNNWMKER